MNVSISRETECVCGSMEKRPVVIRKNGFDITRCVACGVGRSMIDHFDPEGLYTAAYFNGKVEGAYVDYEGSQVTLRREFRNQVEFLKSLLPAGGKLLEIGCAYGFFLQEAQSSFDVHGIEVAQTAVDFCHASGLAKVQRGVMTEDFLQFHGPFDAIVMLDVIEHIDNVEATIQMLARYLRVGGVFLITTGDWSSASAKIMGKRWRLLTPPLHLWFFTPRSLVAMFGKFGLKEEHLSHPWKFVPIELIISQLFLMLGCDKVPALPSAIKKLGLPANMFDAMRIVFRRQN